MPAILSPPTDGTGIVHTAVMYGEDDFAWAKKRVCRWCSFSTQRHLQRPRARVYPRRVYKKGGEGDQRRSREEGLALSRENHTHSYPHCYRCGTPLIYNAVGSWFINIQKIKAKMLKENERINWVPAHLKEGRFKHIVENAPDWTISRNRFWASPLPIWKEKGGSGSW
jgi:isoleucyl-tRNA synthetase